MTIKKLRDIKTEVWVPFKKDKNVTAKVLVTYQDTADGIEIQDVTSRAGQGLSHLFWEDDVIEAVEKDIYLSGDYV